MRIILVLLGLGCDLVENPSLQAVDDIFLIVFLRIIQSNCEHGDSGLGSLYFDSVGSYITETSVTSANTPVVLIGSKVLQHPKPVIGQRSSRISHAWFV